MNRQYYYRLRLNIYEYRFTGQFLMPGVLNHKLTLNRKWSNYLTTEQWCAGESLEGEVRIFDLLRFTRQMYMWRFAFKKVHSFHSGRNSVLLFTNNSNYFSLVLYFAEKYKQQYLLGWWRGLISNWFRTEKFLDTRNTRYRYNFKVLLKPNIAIFIDLAAPVSLVFVNEFQAISTGTLCISLVSLEDEIKFSHLHFFTTKSLVITYYYVLLIFRNLYADFDYLRAKPWTMKPIISGRRGNRGKKYLMISNKKQQLSRKQQKFSIKKDQLLLKKKLIYVTPRFKRGSSSRYRGKLRVK